MLKTEFCDVNDYVQQVVELLQKWDVVDASYEVKELYVPENKLHLTKTDTESFLALKINSGYVEGAGVGRSLGNPTEWLYERKGVLAVPSF